MKEFISILLTDFRDSLCILKQIYTLACSDLHIASLFCAKNLLNVFDSYVWVWLTLNITRPKPSLFATQTSSSGRVNDFVGR
jgi:hypothetical protein